MKTTIESILIITVLIFSGLSLSAQEKKEGKIQTVKFMVQGNCDMCKERIENAALIKGVKVVNWDKMTDSLTVIYRIDKVELDDVHRAVADAGHDTEKVKASDEVYRNLPACCAYRDESHKH